MPSRRAHTKSRLGCIQCKARRVKCSQTYPTCDSCLRHEKTCVYAQVKSGSSSVATRSPTAQTSEHGAPSLPPSVLASPPDGPIFDSLDMRLMHHFCTSTAGSLSLSPRAQDVWRHIMPDKAYENHMLMHGLLTVAAFHYVHAYSATSDPTTLHKYQTRALHHQALGLQLFRHQLQSPGEDQPHENLLMFAATVGILTFADANSTQQGMTYDDALALLAVIRGKQALWRAGSGVAPDSDIAPAFYDPPPPECMADLSEATHALDELHKVTKDNIRGDAIALLKGATESRTSSEFRTLGTWPAGMSDDFLQLLKARDRVGLQVFEHYCTILDSKRDLWWIGDFGLKLRSAIRGAMVPE